MIYIYIYLYVYLLKNFAILGWFQLSLPSYGFYGLWSAMVRLRQTQIIPHLIMDGTNTMSSIAQRGKEGKVLGLLTKTCPLTLDAPKNNKCLLWIMPHLAWVSRVQRVAVLPKVDVGKGLGQGCGTPIDIGKTIAQQPAVLRICIS